MATDRLQAKREDPIGTQRLTETFESPTTSGPALLSDQDLLQGVRAQIQLVDQNLAYLEERLYCAPGAVAAYRRELDNSRMALAAANEKYSACYNTLVREQQRLAECSREYKIIYEQNGQMGNEMHSLATTNVSLRQELERAYKTIESSHTQNVEFEALLDSIVMTDSVTEAG